MLVELIAKNAGQDQKKWDYYPSPSKVGKCIRALTYHAIGVPAKPFGDRTMLVFEDGNWAEELIKDHIRKTVYKLTEWKGRNQRIEIAYINHRIMTGEIDGLIEDPLGETMILEIKSINHFGFERLTDAPQDDHRRQTNLYLHGLNHAGFKINKALILYKNKNTSAMKEFIIAYDEDQALADIEMFRKIDAWAKENKVPPRPYDRDVDWQCTYCQWSEKCYENYESEFEKLSDDVALDQEAETMFKFYLELSGQRKEIEKQEDDLKAQIKALLRNKQAKGATAGPYLARIMIQSKTTIDKKLIPADILKEVEKKTTFEKLTIRQIADRMN